MCNGHRKRGLPKLNVSNRCCLTASADAPAARRRILGNDTLTPWYPCITHCCCITVVFRIREVKCSGRPQDAGPSIDSSKGGLQQQHHGSASSSAPTSPTAGTPTSPSAPQVAVLGSPQVGAWLHVQGHCIGWEGGVAGCERPALLWCPWRAGGTDMCVCRGGGLPYISGLHGVWPVEFDHHAA